MTQERGQSDQILLGNLQTLGSAIHVATVGPVPLLVGAGLWLDWSDPSTVVLDTGIVDTLDKAGKERDANQANTADQPAYQLAVQNGRNVCEFVSSDFFNMFTGLDFLAGVSHTVFAVLKVTGNFTNLYGAVTGSQGNQSLHAGFQSGTQYRLNYWGNDFSPAITANFNVGAFNLVRWTWTIGSPKSVHANGLLEATGGPNAGTIAAMSGGGRLCNVVGQGFLQAQLGELVMVPNVGVMPAEEITELETYLTDRWAI